MASKTVWIVGGLVVAIGAIAYLSYHKAPAGTDAAGTIVEAKRAHADGTNSFNPSPNASTTDQNASDASKAMAGPDAAKDAAEAAGSSGDKKNRRADDAKAAAEAANGGASLRHAGSANAGSANAGSANAGSANAGSANNPDKN
jgi:hypothetical protein